MYTCESMNNVKQVLQVASSSFANIHSNAAVPTFIFNCSNGVKINGLEPLILIYVKSLALMKLILICSAVSRQFSV